MSRIRRILILYHYFHPDEVVSAQHYSHLAEELRARGWAVVALVSNRSRHSSTTKYTKAESWHGVEIRRVWRPNLRQSSVAGRLLVALWMVGAWGLAAFRRGVMRDVDVVIVGTDPVMSLSCIPLWKLARPKIRIVHWCFDLFPDIAVEEGLLQKKSIPLKILRKLFGHLYALCDLVIDTGSCQKKRLETYGGAARRATCTPWAIVEPPEPLPINEVERKAVFGDAKLALLYSGNLGRAYGFDLFLELAGKLIDGSIRFAFGVRGARHQEVKRRIRQADTNINLYDFVAMDRLAARLSAPDIHLVSLRPEWTGTLVPSKFFGALAIGRPVIFYGSPESAVAKWILTYRVGWVLTRHTVDSVSADLIGLASDPSPLEKMRTECHRVYHEHFAKKKVIDIWDRELLRLFGA